MKLANTIIALRTFQSESILTGKERCLCLQKVVAAAIAYAAPCFNGDMSSAPDYYRTSVQRNGVNLISAINERFIINIDETFNDARALWFGRYALLNLPTDNRNVQAFHDSLKSNGADVKGEYERWVNQFITAVKNDWDSLSDQINAQ